MTMLGSFEFDKDEPHAQATTINRRTKSGTHTDNALIYGNVYIGNTEVEQRVDCSKPDVEAQHA